MSSSSGIQDFLVQVVAEFALAFEPLADALQSEDTIDGFLGQFGWKLGAGANIDQVTNIFGNLPEVIKNLKPLSAKLLEALKNKEAPDLAAFQQVISLVKSVVDLVNKIGTNPLAADLEPFNRPEFQSTFPGEVIEYLVFDYVEQRTPRLFGALYMLGVFHEPNPDSTRPCPKYSPRRTNWHMLSVIFGAPQDVFKEAYGWGEPAYEQRQRNLMVALSRLMAGFQIPAGLLPASDLDLDRYYNATNPSRKAVPKLNAPLVQRIIIDEVTNTFELGRLDLNALPVPPQGQKNVAPTGLAMYPFLTGEFDIGAIPVTDQVSISLRGGLESAGGIWLELHPGKTTVSADLPNVDLDAELRLLAERPANDPWILVGRKDSTHIWLAKAHLALQVKGPRKDIEAIIEAAADAAAFVLDFGEGDGFLSKIFGEDPQVIDLAASLRWSSRHGLSVTGQSGFEINLALHQSIGGIVHLDNLLIRLKAGEHTGNEPRPVEIQLAVTAGVKLGPVAAIVEQVGVKAVLTFPPLGGNLGPVNLALGFKPPDGAGLSINASIVSGGGYLFFKPDEAQYGGAVYLEIAGKFSLTALGLITTRMPDGKPGFAMMIIIAVEFSPGIQLGYGFTLNGVGGLLGVNRTVKTDVLRAGIRTGMLNSILFPKNVIENAPQIISNLSAAFPPLEGHFIVGPAVKIGWASIISIELGIALEFAPAPQRVLIMGRLIASLPKPDNVIVHLQMDSLGIIDFVDGTVSLDATIYDSRIAALTLSGDMALRAGWGAHPEFLLSVGGYHPDFRPPANFPALRRLSVALSKDGDSVRLRLETYLALTANTVQTGARLEVYAEAGDFSISGFLGFDVLVHFNPFQFQASIQAGVAFKWGKKVLMGVMLDLRLTGPQPWLVTGFASFSFLGISKSVPIDLQIGKAKPEPPLQAEDVIDLLLQALQDAHNWNSPLPADEHSLVALVSNLELLKADPEKTKGIVWAHPCGGLSLRQRVVPLNQPIAKFGDAPVMTGQALGVAVRFGDGAAGLKTEVEKDYFAPAQFIEMSDAEKLSRASFELWDAGVRLEMDNVQISQTKDSTIDYEVHTLTKSRAKLRSATPAGLTATDLEKLIPFGAAAQVPIRNTGRALFASPALAKNA